MPKKPNPVFTTIRPTYEWSTKVPVIISTPITVTPNIEMNIKINKSTNIPLFTKEITTIPTSSTKAPSSTSTTTEAPKTTVTQKTKNPWNHLWTTTPVPDTKIKVSVLQAGNIRILKVCFYY